MTGATGVGRRLLAALVATAALLWATGPAAAATPVAEETAGPRAPQIVGGSGAPAGAWPWLVRVEFVGPDGFFDGFFDGRDDVFYNCAGSLVGASWVLTAGHCVVVAGLVVGSPALAPGVRLRVVVGETALLGGDPANIYDIAPAAIFYPAVPAGTTNGDIALLRLPRPAPQRAIRILGPGQDARSVTAPGTPAVTAGWGSTSEASSFPSGALLQVEVPIVSDDECAFLYAGDGTGLQFVPATMLCAGSPGRDECYGDSGAPLMAPLGVEWLQVGIVSWGAGCARLPGVYAEMASLFGFILTTTRSDRLAPTGPPAATTGSAARVKRRSATISGTVAPNGLATSYAVELGTNRRFAKGRVEGYAGAGGQAAGVRATFTRLEPGTTYSFRVAATNLGGVDHGETRTFTTKPAKKNPAKKR